MRGLMLGVRATMLAMGLVFAATLSAHAQGPLPGQPTRDELNPAARAPAPAAPRSDLLEPEPPGPCPLRDTPLKVTLRSVTLRGLTSVPQDKVAPAYADLLGKELPVGALCDVRDRVSGRLFAAGLLARVEIPEQRIADGALVLDVIEARIVNVRVRGDAGPAQEAVERVLGKLRGMTPFDLNAAQRYLLLAGDVPGVSLRVTVRPSSVQERGAVDLDVRVTRDPVDVVVGAQNLGGKALGPWSAMGRVDFSGFTALGERTSLVVFSTLDGDEQRVVQLLEEVRLGGEGLVGRANVTYAQTHPGDQFAALALEGEAVIVSAEVAYPVIRTRRRNLNVAGGFDWIDQTTDFSDLARLTDDKLRVIYARIDGDWRPRTAMPFAASGALTVRQGLAGLGASDRGAALLSRFGADPSALLVRGELQASLGVVRWMSANLRLEGQYTADHLLAYEEISAGALTVGRGYDPGSATGDRGLMAAFELRGAPFLVSEGFTLSPYAFVDAAWLKKLGNASADLSSVGVGGELRMRERLRLNVAYAKALEAAYPGAGKPGGRVLVTLTAVLR
jgi:hemolysin activation/secretion protein